MSGRDRPTAFSMNCGTICQSIPPHKLDVPDPGKPLWRKLLFVHEEEIVVDRWQENDRMPPARHRARIHARQKGPQINGWIPEAADPRSQMEKFRQPDPEILLGHIHRRRFGIRPKIGIRRTIMVLRCAACWRAHVRKLNTTDRTRTVGVSNFSWPWTKLASKTSVSP